MPDIVPHGQPPSISAGRMKVRIRNIAEIVCVERVSVTVQRKARHRDTTGFGTGNICCSQVVWEDHQIKRLEVVRKIIPKNRARAAIKVIIGAGDEQISLGCVVERRFGNDAAANTQAESCAGTGIGLRKIECLVNIAILKGQLPLIGKVPFETDICRQMLRFSDPDGAPVACLVARLQLLPKLLPAFDATFGTVAKARNIPRKL